jgi:uncharacterized protein DUF5681
VARWQKGQSGNPGGRPRADPLKIDLLAEIRLQLSSVDPESRKPKYQELVQALISMACGGDVRACQELLSRIHGKLGPPEPAEKLDLETIARKMAERHKQIRPAGPDPRGVPPENEPTAPPAVSPPVANDRPLPCGLVELPAPRPEPDPASRVTPEQEAAELAGRDLAERERQEQARRLIQWGDLAIFPGLGE